MAFGESTRSAELEAFVSDRAPAPIGPYSQAVRAGSFLFCSGQTPIDPATGELVPGDVAAQARQVMKNLEAVLGAAGLSFTDVAKSTIFLVDMGDFGAVNGVYAGFFTSVPPARSTVAVAALPRNARVEIEMIASFGEGSTAAP
jgi:2-iminobutanoate/2-iminopropanoate deaminase